MLPRLRRVAAAAVALVVLAGGCSLVRRDGRPAPEGGSSVGALSWRDCADDTTKGTGRLSGGANYQCATLRVPRDWAAPGGPTFDLSLIRARATGQRDRIGSLVVNPGGPGASGVDLAVYLSAGLPAEVTRRFDIVGFDPRGVGRSSPVDCFSDADLDRSFAYDPDPASAEDFAGAVALTRQFADNCAQRYGDGLALYSTEQAARDMDAVRAAVGDEKITYLGYSYGTLLGATYAQLFPQRVRAMVLDGAIDPRQGFIESSEGQARGFERAFANFTTWCRDNPSRCPIAPDAGAALASALTEARATGGVRADDGRRATAGWIFTGVISSLYTQQGWVQLASALDDLRDGDPEGLFNLADRYTNRDSAGRYSNLFDANAAVNCADTDQRITTERVRELQSEWRTKYPLFGAPLAIGMLTCAQWHPKRDPYPTGPAPGAPPVLVVGTTGDPATPYEQTPKLADMLGVGVVLTWNGEGHTAYPETRCVTEAVNRYLIEAKAPDSGLTCPAT